MRCSVSPSSLKASSATRNAQFARQYALGGDTALNTAAHHLPDPGEVLLQRFFTVQSQFVLHHQTGERQTRLLAVAL